MYLYSFMAENGAVMLCYMTSLQSLLYSKATYYKYLNIF